MRVHRLIGLKVIALTLGLAGVAAAQPTPPPAPEVEHPLGRPRVIRVTGEGEVEAAPDQAKVTLAVETTAPNAEKAGASNATRMDGVIRALKSTGLSNEKIQTGRYELFPNYPPPNERGEQGKPISYRAVNTVEVTVDDLKKVGQVIDTALSAGANRVDQVGFQLKDPSKAQGQALQQAVQRARAQAGVLARALGVELGPVLVASTATAPPPPVPMMAKALGAREAAPPTPIQPQAQRVTASVTLVYGIAG